MALVSRVPIGLKFAALRGWTWYSDLACRREIAGEAVQVTPLRIAFVKSTLCRELYRCSPGPHNVEDLVRSSTWRSGPLGLFVDLGADFYIVHPFDAPECGVYETRDAGNEEARRLRAECAERQAAFACAASEVDWSRYDLVIVYDNAIPSAIALRHPSTIWATMHEDHRLASYAANRAQLPAGYSLFLNLRLGPSPHDWRRKPWEVDFSYGFKSSRTFGGASWSSATTSTVCVEDHHSDDDCRSAAHALGVSVEKAEADNLWEYLSALNASSVFWVPAPDRPLGGLAALDAAALGKVVVANRSRIWNSQAILPELHCNGWADGQKIVARLLSDKTYYADCLARQTRLLDWYNFGRPLRTLAAACATPKERN